MSGHVIYTADGAYDFSHPDLSDLTVEEVAASMSRLYRWRGACPVSVGMHSVAMARSASSERAAKFCMLHDVSEILTGDAPAPLKGLSYMRPFVRAEERLTQAVYDRFGLAGSPSREVRRLDFRARRAEVEDWLPHALPAVEGIERLGFEFRPAWSPSRSRREYLAEADRLGLE